MRRITRFVTAYVGAAFQVVVMGSTSRLAEEAGVLRRASTPRGPGTGPPRSAVCFASNEHHRVRGHYVPPAEGTRTGSVRSRRTCLTVRPGSPT